MQGDFHHWVDLFNHFDSFFEKHIKSRKDLQIEDSFLDLDHSFPKEAVLQILRVIRIILENCTNKHFYSSYEVYFAFSPFLRFVLGCYFEISFRSHVAILVILFYSYATILIHAKILTIIAMTILLIAADLYDHVFVGLL